VKAPAWHALVAIILATGATVAVVLLSVSVMRTPGHVTAEESTLLSSTLGVIVGAAAAYLGSRVADDNANGPH